jgi:hypothetical protein
VFIVSPTISKGAFGGRDIGVVEYWKIEQIAETCSNSQSSRMAWRMARLAGQGR